MAPGLYKQVVQIGLVWTFGGGFFTPFPGSPSVFWIFVGGFFLGDISNSSDALRRECSINHYNVDLIACEVKIRGVK